MADGEIKDLGAQLDGLDLPIMEVVDDMRAQVAASPLTIIAAPPGAGKTTVVPLLLAGERWAGPAGRIIVLEPRRLAARAAAQRMAELAGGRVGDLVGLRARLETRVGARTRIEVVTEGVFTRMILDDPALEGVAAVVFDEFHERSVEADLALALVRDSQSALRADLKIVLMSATLDLEALPRALGDPPVVASRGRMYPVETVYLGRPRQGSDIALAAASAAVSALGRHEGSVLVFLPGAGEIRRAMTMVEERLPEGASVDVHGLFGAMDPRAQDAAIAPPAPGRRKVVLASPIAETSLTIEGVGVVIDAGLKRQPRFRSRAAG